MITCEDYHRLMVQWTGQKGSSAVPHDMLGHEHGCARCKAERLSHQALDAALRAMPIEPLPAALASRLTAIAATDLPPRATLSWKKELSRAAVYLAPLLGFAAAETLPVSHAAAAVELLVLTAGMTLFMLTVFKPRFLEPVPRVQPHA